MLKTKTVISICQYANKPPSLISQRINIENISRTCQTQKKNERSCLSVDLATPFSKTSSIPSFIPMSQSSQSWLTGHKQPTLLTRESKPVSSKTWKTTAWTNRYITNTNYKATQSKSKNSDRRATGAKRLIYSGSSKPQRAQMSQVASKTWLLGPKMINKNS